MSLAITFLHAFSESGLKNFIFSSTRISILRYNPARGRIEFGTWTDKQERERSLACWQIGRDREADGKPVAEWRRTIYGIGWVPLGGYCKIAGMIDESMDREQMAKDPEPWEFRTRPAWQRLLVMVGGVVFNFLMAVAIYIGLVYSYGDKGIRFRDAYAGLDFVPAAIDAGFRPGDIPLMADGQEIETIDPDAALKMAQAKVVSVLRGGKDTVDVAIPEQFMFDINDQKGFLLSGCRWWYRLWSRGSRRPKPALSRVTVSRLWATVSLRHIRN